MKKRTKKRIEILESRIQGLQADHKRLQERLIQMDDVLFAIKIEIQEHVLKQQDSAAIAADERALVEELRGDELLHNPSP